jgi:polygalacturonase
MKKIICTFIPLVGLLIGGPVFAGEAGTFGDPGAADRFMPAQPEIPARTFVVTDYGVVGDAVTMNTDGFRQAIDAVAKAGGGTLEVPPGVYLTGHIVLGSSLNLHLDRGATLLFAPPKELSYAGDFLPALLSADQVHDLEISGEGTIDGSGDAWWPAVHTSMHGEGPRPGRPHMIIIDHCARLRVEGVTLTHSPAFDLVPKHSQDVTIDGIYIYNPAPDYPTDFGVDPLVFKQKMMHDFDVESPNTDGIDPSICQRVLITHCKIDTGDDCIAIKANPGAVTEDVVIRDCLLLHGHGCTVGSGSAGGLRNMVVQRCTFRGTESGVNLESARDRGSAIMENITFRDLTMENVGDAIMISDFYPTGARPYRNKNAGDLPDGGHGEPQAITSTTPCWHHIQISNIRATCYWEAGMILGLPEKPIDGLVLADLDIEAPHGLRISYATNVALHHVDVRVKTGDPITIYDTVTNVVR